MSKKVSVNKRDFSIHFKGQNDKLLNFIKLARGKAFAKRGLHFLSYLRKFGKFLFLRFKIIAPKN